MCYGQGGIARYVPHVLQPLRPLKRVRIRVAGDHDYPGRWRDRQGEFLSVFAHTHVSLTVYYGDRKSTQSTNTSASTRAALTPSSMARPYVRTSPLRNFHADHVCCICVGTRGSRRRCHCACGRRTQRKRSTSLALHGSDTEAHLQFVNKGQTPLILSTVSAFPAASVAFWAAKSTLVGRMTG